MQLKKIINSLTATSVSWLLLGAFGVLAGALMFYKWRFGFLYPSAGLISLGAGGILCGLTNGFTDQSPTGRIISKFGLLALLAGVLLIGYYAYRFI